MTGVVVPLTTVIWLAVPETLVTPPEPVPQSDPVEVIFESASVCKHWLGGRFLGKKSSESPYGTLTNWAAETEEPANNAQISQGVDHFQWFLIFSSLFYL